MGSAWDAMRSPACGGASPISSVGNPSNDDPDADRSPVCLCTCACETESTRWESIVIELDICENLLSTNCMMLLSGSLVVFTVVELTLVGAVLTVIILLGVDIVVIIDTVGLMTDTGTSGIKGITDGIGAAGEERGAGMSTGVGGAAVAADPAAAAGLGPPRSFLSFDLLRRSARLDKVSQCSGGHNVHSSHGNNAEHCLQL